MKCTHVWLLACPLFVLSAGCGLSDTASGSEIATSTVSGALNNGGGSTVAWMAPRQPSTILERLGDALNPVATAWGAHWTCSGGKLSPTFAGDGTYTYTPLSCSVSWLGGKSASSEWSSTFQLAYSGACNATGAAMKGQAGGCTATRTTASGGNTRTVTGPRGNIYAVTHDTNGAGTGYDGDTSESPAPSDSGLIVECASGGCASGGTLTVSGSHIVATLDGKPFWNHTVWTPTPLTVSIADGNAVVNGSVTVQHNLLKETSTTTFTDVTYSDPTCCFPTSGSVSSTTTGKTGTETLTFSSTCGESTLTPATGKAQSLTLQHCI